MKTVLIAFSIFISVNVFSQNITNTLGTGGAFTIKDASNNYLTLSQTNGQVNILRSLRLENTTSSSLGILFKGPDRFLHNYGTNNTFLGINSGNLVMTGADNTAVGKESLLSNTDGFHNTALGGSSLISNTSGFHNTAVGVSSLLSNTTGFHNTAVGVSSLFSNTTGFQNTAMGWNSLFSNITGNNNTAIGYDAQVPSGTADNQVRVGNTLVTYAGIQVAWTVTSDRKWKSNILNSNLGLNFISKLRPVLYIRNNDEKQRTEYGFIAQEIEDVFKESGVDNSGMINIDDEGRYEMRYNDLLAPMVKAIQELKAENDLLKQNNEKLSTEVVSFKSINEKLSAEIESFKSINAKLVKLEQKVNELTSDKHTSIGKSNQIKTISKEGDIK